MKDTRDEGKPPSGTTFGLLSIPGLHLETVVVIPSANALNRVQYKEQPKAVSPELLNMLQLVQDPTTVGPELLDPCVVQMDGMPKCQSHGIRTHVHVRHPAHIHLPIMTNIVPCA
jgi:hypothetical protein